MLKGAPQMNNDTSRSQSGMGAGSQSGQSGQSGKSGDTGRWGSWMQDYESGNYDNLPHDDIIRSYRDWSSTAQPDQINEATSYGYQSIPQDRWGDTGQQWSSEDFARVSTRYSSSQEEEEEEGGGIPKPLIGLALAGALAYAAKRFMGSGDEENEETRASEYRVSEQDSTSYSSTTSGQTSGTSYGTGSTSSTGSTAGSTTTWDTGSSGTSGSSGSSTDLGGSGSSSGMSGSSGSSWDQGSSGSSSSGSGTSGSGTSGSMGGSGSGSSGSMGGGSTSS